VGSEYINEARDRLKELGSKEHPPDVFLLQPNSNPGKTAPLIRSWLGPEWKGRFIVSLRKPGTLASYGDARRFQGKIIDLAKNDPSWRDIEIMDEVDMGFSMFHNMEHNMTRGTLHHHHSCNTTHNGVNIRICGPSVEMSAQMLLATVFRFRLPDEDPLRQHGGYSFSLCQDCATVRVMASIKRVPVLECVQAGEQL
jgi:hypothetical protein